MEILFFQNEKETTKHLRLNSDPSFLSRHLTNPQTRPPILRRDPTAEAGPPECTQGSWNQLHLDTFPAATVTITSPGIPARTFTYLQPPSPAWRRTANGQQRLQGPEPSRQISGIMKVSQVLKEVNRISQRGGRLGNSGGQTSKVSLLKKVH